MYPTFITLVSTNAAGSRLLKICDHEFKAFDYDWYIDDAIMLAKRRMPHQISHQHILHLRTWIRENYQHGHEIPYKHIRSMQGCRRLVESIIHAEYANTGEEYIQSRDSALKTNSHIFSLNSS
ncbi:hypothetical protein ACTJJ0_03320 [Chitinophaga sp. 22321]|uniref:Uncharacterized protein n=1 Tax=Chitinophaga hostae TaxID=2831022 RepID=A0ABS5IZS0_9BACT|nr:hypothetical protein [Chitinophaga hostae]MBS0027672.1 hypothetical protein [Chitinophaga hostae]